MISNLQYLGIHEGAIDNVIETCESVCDKYDLNAVRMHSMACDEIYDGNLSLSNFETITNVIIYAYFDVLIGMLVEKGVNEERIDYYINGYDSHFYIDNEEC